MELPAIMLEVPVPDRGPARGRQLEEISMSAAVGGVLSLLVAALVGLIIGAVGKLLLPDKETSSEQPSDAQVGTPPAAGSRRPGHHDRPEQRIHDDAAGGTRS